MSTAIPTSAPRPPKSTLTGTRALARSLGILGTCIAQAPEFVHKKRCTRALIPGVDISTLSIQHLQDFS